MNFKKILICFLIITCFLVHSIERISQPQKKVYKGTINKKFEIQMTIEFNNNIVKGTYFYISQKKDIEIKGNLNSEIITLEEFSNGIKTGIFRGELSELSTITGTWSTPDGKKILTFSLEEISNNLKGSEISGIYENGDAASIDILLIENNKIKFQGSAIWVGQNEGNVHTGEVGGITEIKKGKAVYKDENGNTLTVEFVQKGLQVEEYPSGCFGGLNVSFNGIYKKKNNVIDNWDLFNLINNIK